VAARSGSPISGNQRNARANGDFGAIVGLEKTLAFNLGGHVNHSIFWNNLSPDGGGKPEGELAAALDDHFGSFDAFQAHFIQARLRQSLVEHRQLGRRRPALHRGRQLIGHIGRPVLAGPPVASRRVSRRPV
jgi:hypothetical protein